MQQFVFTVSNLVNKLECLIILTLCIHTHFFMITANYHKSHTILLQMLPCYRMLFILFIADSMGVSESLEGRYLQNLCQVIKSSVCPQKDRSTGAERVSLRNNASLIPFCAGG